DRAGGGGHRVRRRIALADVRGDHVGHGVLAVDGRVVGHRAHVRILEAGDPALAVDRVAGAVANRLLVDVDEVGADVVGGVGDGVAERLLNLGGTRGRDRDGLTRQIDQAQLVVGGVLRVGGQVNLDTRRNLADAVGDVLQLLLELGVVQVTHVLHLAGDVDPLQGVHAAVHEDDVLSARAQVAVGDGGLDVADQLHDRGAAHTV